MTTLSLSSRELAVLYIAMRTHKGDTNGPSWAGNPDFDDLYVKVEQAYDKQFRQEPTTEPFDQDAETRREDEDDLRIIVPRMDMEDDDLSDVDADYDEGAYNPYTGALDEDDYTIRGEDR